jgi:hypothetical protein
LTDDGSAGDTGVIGCIKLVRFDIFDESVLIVGLVLGRFFSDIMLS